MKINTTIKTIGVYDVEEISFKINSLKFHEVSPTSGALLRIHEVPVVSTTGTFEEEEFTDKVQVTVKLQEAYVLDKIIKAQKENLVKEVSGVNYFGFHRGDFFLGEISFEFNGDNEAVLASAENVVLETDEGHIVLAKNLDLAYEIECYKKDVQYSSMTLIKRPGETESDLYDKMFEYEDFDSFDGKEDYSLKSSEIGVICDVVFEETDIAKAAKEITDELSNEFLLSRGLVETIKEALIAIRDVLEKEDIALNAYVREAVWWLENEDEVEHETALPTFFSFGRHQRYFELSLDKLDALNELLEKQPKVVKNK